ncbi:MAG: glycosyltransferase [Erythrobacter sp.]
MTRRPQRQIDAGEAVDAGDRFSVIVPAHNEEAVIARCLRSIYADAPIGSEPEVIVAANGCSDQTVARARDAAPNAIILELEPPSKVLAINEANLVANHFPRLVMDADVEASFASLSATADVLRSGGVMAASPQMELNLADCSAAVRSYYKVWQSLPYASDGLIGGGVYGLSRKGMDRVAPLPNVIGDDLYVRTRFARTERANIAQDDAGNEVRVIMTPPASIGQLIGIEARRRMGKHEVDCNHPSEQSGTINRWQDLLGSLSRGANVFDLSIFVAIKLIAFGRYKLSLSQGQRDWTRDNSSRRA